MFRPSQVHGIRVFRVEEQDEASSFREEGDGLATRRRGVVLAVGCADCVPLILLDSRVHAGAVLHAGWRGTLARIAREGVRLLQEAWASRPSDLTVWIGPSIGPCCYRVGEEVIRAFGLAGFSLPALVQLEATGPHLDLVAANREVLAQSGVPPERIFSSGLCTRCHPKLFPSYRREGSRAGRLLGFLGSSPSP
jgi:purine-nucleoside/S-methyl-5'-thioadenosine phosphorylase / adenosine deaminase